MTNRLYKILENMMLGICLASMIATAGSLSTRIYSMIKQDKIKAVIPEMKRIEKIDSELERINEINNVLPRLERRSDYLNNYELSIRTEKDYLMKRSEVCLAVKENDYYSKIQNTSDTFVIGGTLLSLGGLIGGCYFCKKSQ